MVREQNDGRRTDGYEGRVMRRCGACFLLVSTDDHLCPRCGEEVETELEKLNDYIGVFMLFITAAFSLLILFLSYD